jgi:hypothetical protein
MGTKKERYHANSSLLTFVEGGTLFLQPDACLPAGAGGGFSNAAQSTCRTPRHLASPIWGAAGEPADPAGRQLIHPRPPNSPDFPTWASVARGEGARAVKHCRPVSGQQPAVIAADFMALYDRCLASGLKSRLVFSYAAGHQILTVSCNFPAPAVTTTAAGKRRRRRRHRRCRRHGRAATPAPNVLSRATTPLATIPAAPSPAQDHLFYRLTPPSEENEEEEKQGGASAGLGRE